MAYLGLIETAIAIYALITLVVVWVRTEKVVKETQDELDEIIHCKDGFTEYCKEIA